MLYHDSVRKTKSSNTTWGRKHFENNIELDMLPAFAMHLMHVEFKKLPPWLAGCGAPELPRLQLPNPSPNDAKSAPRTAMRSVQTLGKFRGPGIHTSQPLQKVNCFKERKTVAHMGWGRLEKDKRLRKTPMV